MITPSSELKSLIKSVNSVKAEHLVLTSGGIVASDSDITVCASNPKFEGFPTIQVNARKFTSIINKMSGDIEITPTDNSLVVKSGKAKLELEFSTPKPRVFGRPEKLHTLPLQPVRDLLKYASVAADTNKAAAQGGVVQFETVTDLIEDKAIAVEAMATDGKRCAYSTVNLELPSNFRYVIPLPAVAAIQSLTGDSVQIGEAASFYYISSGSATVYANKLSKTFPNYKAYLPKSYKFSATLDAAAFKSVLSTVETMVQDVEQNAVSVHFLDGRLTVRSVGKGEYAEDEMAYEADPLADVTEFKVKIDHRFLWDFVSAVSGDVVFNGNGQQQPVILESGNRKMMITTVVGGS